MKKNITYNTISFIVFSVLLLATFSFFSFADEETGLTLFEDFDRDGLSNDEEEVIGTDPNEADTDGDGYSDGVEVESGYDPLIPAPGDRIVKDAEEKKELELELQPIETTNVTQKISTEVVSFLADAQEEGRTDISPEELDTIINESIEKEVEFEDVPPIDLEEIEVKEQDYDEMPEDEKKEQEREDVIEYLTAVSYIFVSSFPQDFFDRSVDEFSMEVMQNLNGFTDDLSQFAFFEELAQNALKAEQQLDQLEVPEDMLEIHSEGLYLLRYIGNIYQAGEYKKVQTDITPMIATLAQFQGLMELSMQFQEKIEQKMEEYEIEEFMFTF